MKKIINQKEKVEDETIQDDNAADALINDQNQPSTSSSNDEQPNKVLDDKMSAIEKTFQSKMSLMEVNTDAFQKELDALKQEKLQQHEKTKELREKLARMEAGIQDDAQNDLNYDSSDNEDDSNNDINYDSECSNSEQEDDDNNTTSNSQQQKENPNLVKTSADPDYDSSDNEDFRNDIYLD